MLTPVGDGQAARRWKALVRARRAEIERLAPDDSSGDLTYWERRAKRATPRLSDAEGDPFLSRLRRACGGRTTVLDVGSGPGRFALALAPRVAEVVAVDPSPTMLAILRREARRQGVSNVRTVEGCWGDVAVDPVDVVFASYVLPVVEDAPGFLRRMDAVARRRAFVYLGAFTSDALVDPLWRHFHGRSRRPGPTWLDAIDVLREIGIDADVEVVEVANRTRFSTLADAVRDYQDLLVLADTREVRRELAALLGLWLVADDHGLRPPIGTLPAAVLRWEPTGSAAG